MATYIDFSIKNRDELKDWILSELGYPLVTVELTDNHLDSAINTALEFYTEYSDMEERFVVLPLSGYIPNEGLSLSGYNARSIFSMDAEFNGGSSQLFSMEHQLINSGIFPLNPGTSQSFVTYELASQWSDLSDRMLCKKYDFNYNVRKQLLTLYPQPEPDDRGYIILGLKIVPSEEDLVGELYVKILALAKAKMMLGVIRKKFDGVQLPGGGTIDSSIGDEGKEQWDKAFDEIIKYVGPHNSFYIG
jgi:hypothetical protein